MAAEWNTLVERIDIHQAGHPTITAVALTSRHELEDETQLTGNRSDLYAKQCIAGSCRLFSLQQHGRRIATTELLTSEDGWVHWSTTGANGSSADPATVNAALILARAYRTLQLGKPSQGLNPLMPDPDAYPFADERIQQAAALGQTASHTDYDPENPLHRSKIWAQCLEQARLGAMAPVEAASLHEVAFAHQLAVNAAVLCQDYAAASEIVPHALAMGRNAQELAQAQS